MFKGYRRASELRHLRDGLRKLGRKIMEKSGERKIAGKLEKGIVCLEFIDYCGCVMPRKCR